MNSQATNLSHPDILRSENDHSWSVQPDEDRLYFSITGLLLAMQYTHQILSDCQSEALGRAVLRYSRFLTQDLLLDPVTSAEIVREFVREWVTSRAGA